ncbi:MAG TPA: hypothetical protein VMX33_11520 [bacterium]|nr:hypothetical protein [bacterium]
MLDSAEDFLGRVTFVTGPEKHCGKTTFMNRAAELARRGARASGRPGPALLTAGYDGESRDFLSGARKPAVPVWAGDFVLTTERFARPCFPEIIDVLPGHTALGRLCVARARRASVVALVGPDGNSQIAWAIDRIVAEGLTDTVLVDGAINRITQVASINGARFVYVLRVDRSTLAQALAKVRRIGMLIGLPIAAEASSEAFWLDDALTAETVARLPAGAREVVVEDLTKVFLGDSELRAFIRERALRVRRSISFGGFVVSCRGLCDDEFLGALDDERLAGMIAFNPYELARGMVA